MNVHLTANGSVLCYDTVPAEFLTKIINIEDGAERFEKHNLGVILSIAEF